MKRRLKCLQAANGKTGAQHTMLMAEVSQIAAVSRTMNAEESSRQNGQTGNV